jgi:hypothetical protein
MGDLRQRYDGFRAALSDVVVFRATTGRIHRPEGDGEAWCNTTTDVEYVDLSRALAVGGELCKSCYRPALAHLARMDSSPVIDTKAEHDTPAAVSTTNPGTRPSEEGLPLGAITASVLVATGGADTYHAPGEDGAPACDTSVTTTRRRLDQTPPSARPCRRCFADAVVDRYAGRGGGESAVVEAAEARK